MEIYNLKSPAVKRLMREAEELRNATEVYYAQPLEDNLFEWHFTVRGPPKSDFDGGVYHGRILLPVEYPMKPPNIILLTPNGRFEVNKKICLSISGHHPETWQPSWSIRTALLAIIGFMPTHGNGAIGSLDYSPEERQSLARKSRKWHCPECGSVKNLLCEESDASTSTAGNEIEKPSSCYTKEPKEEEEDMNSEITVTNHVEMDVNTQPHISFEPSIDKIFEPLHPPEPSDVTHSIALEENQVRQRLLQQASNENHSTPDIPDELTHVSDYQLLSLRTLTTACMYVIVFLLGVLIIRRLFFF